MARGRGKAKDVGSPFWQIVGPSGAILSEFRHASFPRIRDGARVQYIDDDGDGIAEQVQSVADVDRVVGLALSDGHRFGRGARLVLSHHVVIALGADGTGSEAIERRIAELRTAAGRSEGVIDAELLRSHGLEG